MIMYVHSTDGVSVDSGISIEPRDGWTRCVYEPPKAEADEVCVCAGFDRDGDGFVARFEVHKVEGEEMKYSTGLILEAIGKMGAAVYDAAKAYMQANRVNGAVIWDLLVSGDYIEADNPCVIAAREMVIADGICTAEQFDAVLAASVISE